LDPKAAIAITGTTSKLEIIGCLMNEQTGLVGIERVFYASAGGKLTFKVKNKYLLWFHYK